MDRSCLKKNQLSFHPCYMKLTISFNNHAHQNRYNVLMKRYCQNSISHVSLGKVTLSDVIS